MVSGELVMSHSNLTRWIETADARSYTQGASVEPNESHYLDLGETIAKMPSWLRLSTSREALVAIGCNALDYVRHPLAHLYH